MKLYRVVVHPDETGSEAEDHDEWSWSLAKAKRIRARLIRLDPGGLGFRYGENFAIQRVELPRLDRAGILAVLGRRFVSVETVVGAYVPSERARKRALEAARAEEEGLVRGSDGPC